ncbi:SRPBCC domain-containing protein [Streptomyces glomeratus]|uniref:Activator of Hsp90 ATPase homologue 1/2-like C-terminal domain-containing protein n=1 Tax=Streptomyces glomeratus TaxID=284452 RepID=A0ABP6LNY5_9ACTN|nr:SRPBCC domain-containing protein [Streptomyces glomeratus]MCF1511333.1 SRPBCC domain-containing protein [Streptomyces glomeratus]
MTNPIEEGTAERRGDLLVRHYLLRLARPVEEVWPALATSTGLGEWLASAEPFEPRLGGAVALRLPEGIARGRITAWDVERVAEYTVEGRGRIRFHLEPGRPAGTTVRFTHESEQSGDPGWRERFERLLAVVEAGDL